MRFKIFGSLLLVMMVLTAVFWGIGLSLFGINWMFYVGVGTLCAMVIMGILVHIAYFFWEEEFDWQWLTIIVRIIAWLIAPIPGIFIGALANT